ncbi:MULTISPECIES: ATP-binding protein [Thermomonospora]|nr:MULTISPECIES: ATP-binding protein [Thermomonospora]PKK14487.1 MAG: ATP-binding protein [Thermomonospora sp. CIF 1]
MILDQADDTTTDTLARDGRRHWWLSALDDSSHSPGHWPTPPAGSPRTARIVLRTEAASPKAARDFTARTLAEWELSDSADDVTMVVSELVTNAVRYGLDGLPPSAQLCPVQLALFRHPHRLVVVVTDPSEHIPRIAEAGADRFSESGRGLLVVQALSNAWGWAPLSTGGKAVWAAFDLRRRRTL